MFYRFRQNNSGGRFVFDAARGISVVVWVEADDWKDANRRAMDIGLYFHGGGDCPCCGSRWSELWEDEGVLSPPTVVNGYSDYGARRENKGAASGYIHYRDGSILPMGFRKL